MSYLCFYVKHIGALDESIIFCVHRAIYTYFKWNIDILDQLEHIYTYFKWNIDILDQLEHIYIYFKWNIKILKGFAYISHELLIFWNIRTCNLVDPHGHKMSTISATAPRTTFGGK